MPYTSIKKKISCSKENLIKMVLDIEKYPEYVPWCLDGKIHNKIDKGKNKKKVDDNFNTNDDFIILVQNNFYKTRKIILTQNQSKTSN